MLTDIISPFTTLDDWKEMREQIRTLILDTLGEFPEGTEPGEVRVEELEQYEKNGFQHVKIKYSVTADMWTEAVCVKPKNYSDGSSYPSVIAIHGSHPEGKYSLMNPEERPRRNYVYELAERGYAVFAPDQFSVMHKYERLSKEELVADFFRKYPDWSLDGLHLFSHKSAINAMAKMSFFDCGNIGSIGNSRGGRAVIFLGAFESRVKATVCSTGISPNYTNLWRVMKSFSRFHAPKLYDGIEKTGIIPWDYHQLIALCAPNALLVLEPFNDPYNHDTLSSVQCVHKAFPVFDLMDRAENLQMITHGHGHDTRDEIREYAYTWFDQYLKP